MGGNESSIKSTISSQKSLDIRYHRKSRKETIKISLIQDQTAYPPAPKPDEIKRQLLEILKHIEIDSKQKDQVLKLKPLLQWELICRHNNFLKNNEETIDKVSKSDAQLFVEKLKNNPSVITIQNLRRWLVKASLADLHSFFLFDGVNILLQMLQVAELCSRNTKSYAKALEILRVIRLICKQKEGIQEVLKVANSVTYILFNIHPNHVDLTCLIFEIIGELLWNSNVALELMLCSLTKLKAEKNHNFRFYPFLHILKHSNNVILIENTLMFLNTLVASNVDSKWKVIIKSELLACGIKECLENIYNKLDKDDYKLIDSTYEIIQELLIKDKFKIEEASPVKNVTLSEFVAQEKDMNNYEQQMAQRKHKQKFDKATIIKYRTDTFDESKQIKSLENQINDRISEKNKEEDIDKSISSRDVSYYLESSDQTQFEKHLENLKNQSDVLDKLLKNDIISEDVEKKEDFSNLSVLLGKVKENALKNDCYSSFLSIFQKLVLIPTNDRGVDIWEHLEEFVDRLTGGKKEIVLDNSNMNNLMVEKESIEGLEGDVRNLRETMEVRDHEIKNSVEERNKLMEENVGIIVELKNLNSEKTRLLESLEKMKEERKASNAGKVDEKIKVLLGEIEGLKKGTNDNLQVIEELKKKLAEKEKEIEGLIESLKKAAENTSNEANNKNVPPPPIGLVPNMNNNINIPGPPIGLLPNLNNNNIPGPPIGLLPNMNNNNNNNIPGPPIGLLPAMNNNNIPGPPIGLLGGPPMPPIGLLGGPPMPPNLFGGPPMPPNLLGGPPMPPNLLGGPPMPPNLLGGPPMPPNLFGGPPMPPNLLGGPPGPPNLLGGPPPLNLLGGLARPLGLPGLPGLPGLLNQQNKPKLKEKMNPKVPMKGLMWTIIKPEQIKDTVWEKIDDSKVELDKDSLEKSFCTKKPADPKEGGKIAEKPKIEKISIMVPERSKNVDLVLMKLKLSFVILAQSLYTCDEAILSIGTLESMKGVLPSAAEIKEIKSFEGDIETLANPERFFLEIGEVPGYSERVNALIFAKNYKDYVDDLENKASIILAFWRKCREDEVLLEILQYLLAFGNYLNGTSNRGGAYAYKLDALEKAVDHKATDNPKKNLLMMIIETIENKKAKDLIDVTMDLSDIDTACKVPLMQLTQDLGDIKKGAKSVDFALKKQSDKPIDKIKEKFEAFYVIIIKIIEELEKKIKDCEMEYEKSAKFFCENPKDPSEKLAERFLKLWTACKGSKKELERLKLQAKKENEKKLKEIEKKTVKIIAETKSVNIKAIPGILLSKFISY